jgi:hypothetical protein
MTSANALSSSSLSAIRSDEPAIVPEVAQDFGAIRREAVSLVGTGKTDAAEETATPFTSASARTSTGGFGGREQRSKR